MKWLLTTLTAGLMFCAPASADGLTGRDLAEGCRGAALERVACLAYVEGFVQGFASNDRIMTGFLRDNLRAGHLAVSAASKRVEKVEFCADDALPGEAIRAVYLDWAAGHTAALDRPAAEALVSALSAAFPCRGPATAELPGELPGEAQGAAERQSASRQP